MAEALALGSQHQQALALLSKSVALNLEKGSPLGLAFNRRSLDLLGRTIPPGEARGLMVEVARRLAAAESILGRITLPGEPAGEAG